MLTPKVKAKELAKYGFKRCKDISRDSDMRTALDLYQLIKDGMLESSFYKGDKNVSSM